MAQITISINDDETEQKIIAAMNGKYGDEKLPEETDAQFALRKGKAIMINALRRDVLTYERDTFVKSDINIT